MPKDRKIRVFSGKEGVSINSYNPNSVFKNSNNELFFGGSNGFITFLSEKEDDKSFSPSPVICDIYISNKEIDLFDKKLRDKISKYNIPYSNKITLKYDQKNILIEFSALLFEDISSIKYAYKLQGIDKDWVYVDSKKRFVNYNNLPKGTYTFYVKSCNSEGSWCENPTTLKIKINPAPWDSLWAYLIYITLSLLATFFTARIVLNRIRLQKMLEIEHIEREKSEEVHQAKLKLFTNISHEFFTPITIMNCTIDSMVNRHPEESRSINTLKANMERLVRLLDQIVEFRKVETGNLKLKISKIDIVHFIKELCEIHFIPLCIQKNIELKCESSKDKIEGYIDTDKLDKIVFNLLSNAFKYNKPNGEVAVYIDTETNENQTYVIIKVSDTGYGMDEQTKQNLFKRFYEGNFRDFKVKSIGIGLSLTHDLVEFHKGSISVESTEGKGSTFTVYIPIDKNSYSEELIYKSPAQEEENEKTNKNANESHLLDNVLNEREKIKILLVEDNEELLNIMTNALNQDNMVYKASNGAEAIEILYKKEIDIVVTDIVMPKMDGIELTKEMKKNVEFSHIPVLMLSAKHDVEHKVEGFEAGADAYVTKPFEIPALIANIKSLVKNRKQLATSFDAEPDTSNITKFAHNDTDKEFLIKVIGVIEQNVLEKEFSTIDIYKAMNMSQSKMYRKMQSLIGISPIELIRKIKIQMACKLLVERNLNVSEVTYDLGFSDPKYFSSIFKKETGMSPTDYIKQKVITQKEIIKDLNDFKSKSE